ncbi:hypothetical protein EDC04DRAFT_2701138 [Pisolithus marmoratus]|nr:hypothetical protein EDC04DRAFT_2701138 [Pisolithus marmoratus]
MHPHCPECRCSVYIFPWRPWQRAAFTTGQQLAQKLAAEEKKIALDSEFAGRLQEAIDDGTEDTDNVKDVER